MFMYPSTGQLLSKDSSQPTIPMFGEIETCELVLLTPCM